jgi:hypothetical protein
VRMVNDFPVGDSAGGAVVCYRTKRVNVKRPNEE